VEWVDNQACVDVIEAMPPKGLGVLAVLDSQCRFPKGSDETFMHALGDALASNDHFGTDPRRQGEFFVNHYAGPVSYNATGFLDKNKDMLNTGGYLLLCGCLPERECKEAAGLQASSLMTALCVVIARQAVCCSDIPMVIDTRYGPVAADPSKGGVCV
jgi:myosin-5